MQPFKWNKKRVLIAFAILLVVGVLASRIMPTILQNNNDVVSATPSATPGLTTTFDLTHPENSFIGTVDLDYISGASEFFVGDISMPVPTLTPKPITETLLLPIGINFSSYDPKWEYMEKLGGVNYHPEGDPYIKLEIEFQDEVYYSDPIWLKPGQYRFLHSQLKQNFAVFYGYTGLIQVTADAFEVLDIYDPDMKMLWNKQMSRKTLPPRELNDLETAGLLYSRQQGWDSFTEYPPYNPEDYMSPDEKWSPLEVLARSVAFVDYVTDADNRVFIQTWYGVDVNYRWVDRDTKQVLKLVDSDAQLIQYPPSGWVEMQISPWDQEDWQSDMFKRLVPGYVLGVDQTGDIINSGQVGWALSEMEQAHRTDEWTQEKILNILNKYENIAINK